MGWEIAKDPDISPGIGHCCSGAQRFIGKELRALHNEHIGDAISKEEAKAVLSEVKSTLFERKKKRVHAAASEAVEALEAKVLAMQARKAAKAMKRALSAPTAMTGRKRDTLGRFI